MLHTGSTGGKGTTTNKNYPIHNKNVTLVLLGTLIRKLDEKSGERCTKSYIILRGAVVNTR